MTKDQCEGRLGCESDNVGLIITSNVPYMQRDREACNETLQLHRHKGKKEVFLEANLEQLRHVKGINTAT